MLRRLEHLDPPPWSAVRNGAYEDVYFPSRFKTPKHSGRDRQYNNGLARMNRVVLQSSKLNGSIIEWHTFMISVLPEDVIVQCMMDGAGYRT